MSVELPVVEALQRIEYRINQLQEQMLQLVRLVEDSLKKDVVPRPLNQPTPRFNRSSTHQSTHNTVLSRKPYRPSNRSSQSEEPFPDFHMSNAELFKKLYNAHLMSPIPAKPFEPPYPPWFDPNARCLYHFEVAGHTIENCVTFRGHVMKLFKNGAIMPRKENPSVLASPSCTQEEGGLGTIWEEDEQ